MRRTATSRVLSWLILCCSLISFTNASRPQQSQGNRRIQLMLTEGTSIAAAVSPDGRTVVIDLSGSLWILPSSGGIARRITDEFSDARQPAWSPEGRTIAFQSYRDGGWHIWTVAPDGTALKQLTSGPFDHREPHWSPDGARIAFSSDRSGNYDIWELVLATGQLRQVTNDASNESMPAWSRDGREIAFVSDRPSSPGIWIIDASGQERVVQKTAGATFAPSWSPDGKLLYNVLEGTQSRLMLDGVSVSNDEDVFPFRAQWLSATEFLYTADGKIKRRAPGSPPRIVDFTAALDFNRTSFTPKRRDFDSTTSRPALGIYETGDFARRETDRLCCAGRSVDHACRRRAATTAHSGCLPRNGSRLVARRAKSRLFFGPFGVDGFMDSGSCNRPGSAALGSVFRRDGRRVVAGWDACGFHQRVR